VIKVLAPLAWALAGRRWFPLWAVVQHRGRKSGKQYATPVAIIPARSHVTILIGLPWGSGTNWAQNVLAAGGATLTWKGRDVTATNPRLIGPQIAAQQVKPIVRRIVRSGTFPALLELDRSEP
jgi:deazaflavin-dependent oxidoreductase (nitroreductase family)